MGGKRKVTQHNQREAIKCREARELTIEIACTYIFPKRTFSGLAT
jgi:hypothetical protein